MIKTLVEIYEECSKKNWDSYSAEPVTLINVGYALIFVSLLPEDIVTPEAVPGNDGYIDFEWNKGRDWLSIGAKPDSLVYAAGRTGAQDRHGTIDFSHPVLPPEIESILERFKKVS